MSLFSYHKYPKNYCSSSTILPNVQGTLLSLCAEAVRVIQPLLCLFQLYLIRKRFAEMAAIWWWVGGETITWFAVRTKKGKGTGVSAELGHSSSDISARLSRKPPPEKTDALSWAHLKVSSPLEG